LSTLTNEQSQRLADQVLAAYRGHYDDPAVELMEALQAVLSTRSFSSELKPVKKLYSEVINLANRHIDAQPEAMMSAKIEAGTHLLRVGSRDSRDLLAYADEASKRLGASHEITMLAQFHAGRYQEAAGDYDGAEQRFRTVATVPLANLSDRLAVPKYMSHARLVVLLEQQGKSTEANEHCIAVAQMGYGVTDDHDPTPLFRVNPKYPLLLASRGVTGKVIAEYDISEVGMVENVRIIEAAPKAFGGSSTEAIKQWRFAPRIENGVPVKSTGHQVQLDFTLN
jgi:TonB family protein